MRPSPQIQPPSDHTKSYERTPNSRWAVKWIDLNSSTLNSVHFHWQKCSVFPSSPVSLSLCFLPVTLTPSREMSSLAVSFFSSRRLLERITNATSSFLIILLARLTEVSSFKCISDWKVEWFFFLSLSFLFDG